MGPAPRQNPLHGQPVRMLRGQLLAVLVGDSANPEYLGEASPA